MIGWINGSDVSFSVGLLSFILIGSTLLKPLHTESEVWMCFCFFVFLNKAYIFCWNEGTLLTGLLTGNELHWVQTWIWNEESLWPLLTPTNSHMHSLLSFLSGNACVFQVEFDFTHLTYPIWLVFEGVSGGCCISALFVVKVSRPMVTLCWGQMKTVI